MNPFYAEETKSWMIDAYHALKGAMELAKCLADLKVEIGEVDSPADFLDDDERVEAIRGAIRAYPR